MMDYLDRDSAPLTEQEWARLDDAVVSAARRALIGRRIIEVLGPLGSGVYSIPYSTFNGKAPASIDLTGEKETVIVEPAKRSTINLPILYKDFKVAWRDVEADRHLGLPIDVSTAAIAANFVASQEDDLIFNGNKDLGHEGLLTATGRLTVKASSWEECGMALSDVVKAVGTLSQAGHYGPYAMVVSPVLFGRMVRIYGNSGMLEVDQVRALITDGVYYSNAINGTKAVVIATGSQNINLAIGQDLKTAYLGPANMNHAFRVMETAALLIRRSDSICTIE